jgi:N-acetyl sugar amidotransferase
MRYCSRCLYPENHPFGIIFDEEGVCSGCRIHEEKDVIDWSKRSDLLGEIFEDYKSLSGQTFDCIIPVSGGADSYFIVHTVKTVYKMNPLLVHFNHQYNTRTGIRNLARLATIFDCDIIQSTLNPKFIKRFVAYSLKRFGTIYWHCLAGALTFPVQIAVKLKIPLIVWGVHGWSDQVGMFSHLDEVEMTHKARKEHGLMSLDAMDMLSRDSGIHRSDIQPFVYPYENELERVGVRGVYLSNYIRWDSTAQHEQMISQYGYETRAQERTFNTYEDVACFHSAGLHDYIKFLKYGYGKVTDHACREIRLKRMTREEGIAMVRNYQDRVPADMQIFSNWIGMPPADIISALDRFRDPAVWEKDGNGQWQLNDSVVRHEKDPGVDAVRLEKQGNIDFILTEPTARADVEDDYLLMGRGYIDKHHYCAVSDTCP